MVNVILNVFLYWDIIQYIEKLFHFKTSPDDTETNENKYREYVFIGEIRTSIFEYQLEKPSVFVNNLSYIYLL